LTPKIEAIAVTDYYVTDTYEKFLLHKGAGRLPGVQLLFPNIELRLDVAAKSGFVNVHLLISPEDPEHLSELKRILKRLQFHAFNDRFDCSREELIKLGKRADLAITDDGAALQHGATQFKVTRALDGSDANGHMSFPRARYLSQQFVEELSSAKGVSDGLVDEIERVIFESHSQDDREWAMDFAELREQQTSRFKQAREREVDAIADISERIAAEFEKEIRNHRRSPWWLSRMQFVAR
jgi:hypothetical protein